ncbi:MAG TPA: DNA helicase RecG [Clostridiaceae bacterium]|nr:DNA helicase RecG [Clostridiaceae bacterium]
MDINDSVGTIKGVGQKTKEQLENMGIITLLDLLLYFPRAYDQYQEADEMYFNGMDKIRLEAVPVKITRPFRTRTGKSMSTIYFSTQFGQVKAMFFNMPYVTSNYTIGETYMLSGKFTRKGKNIECINPVLNKDLEEIVPVYPSEGKVTGTLLKKLVRQILDKVIINENFPPDILKEEELVSLDEAVRNLHFPQNRDRLGESLKRMKFQEMFSYSMKIMLSKSIRLSSEEGIMFKMSPRLTELKNRIPFEMTGAQNRVIREILKDQKNRFPMNRLLQGDVGSGKTIVALVALFNVIENGYQGALMAPTEILARQHFEEAKRLLSPMGVEVRLLTGSSKKSERDQIAKELEKGKPLLMVGTHALIEEKVNFSRLGMIITDEQHRFGVNQRAKLVNKSKTAEVLVMSATPIPRTMALTIYSDLDLSVIDELPVGRKEIRTILLDETKRKACYSKVIEEVNKGRQAYIVTPLIDLDEDGELNSVTGLYEELSKGPLKGIRMGYLHGKMSSKEKTAVMDSFKEGEIQVLIATTVIEVGVNVPNASMMVIENAERFGLAQLHQLRGRVGRGEYQSYCIMVANIRSQTTRERLEIMVKSNDGFFIAEEDLKQRGTGQLFGVHQRGHSGLMLSDLASDYELFLRANRYAGIVYNSKDPNEMKMKKEFLDKISKSMNFICLN